ncbi:NAD(P)H-binding protein [Actinomycetospora lutea]|uniref:NmrA family NAD(P)-binding protein n=1 Tax=Actinomycetospora lutea TaxID=663604 RepID=UPI002365A977|nr:NAD(P)H-binding protein [Actinomycetospora lutea]MDD7939322.1 NAD(P)H-binding protein [Actinomycetospora lutea]
MIIVTGASGQLGHAVLERLLDRAPAEQVGASVRDPSSVRDLAERGVRVRRGDYADPASLAEAFDGASRVLVVSANTLGEEGLRQNRAAIEAAVVAGAERVLYTSHAGARPDSPFPPMPQHAANEEVLRGCGAPYTALRHGFYASTIPMLLSSAWHTGELRVPDAGPFAWTTHGDLAAVAALALTDDVLDGITPPLTGPEAVTMEQLADLAADAAGRTIRHVTVPDAEYRAALVERGVPEGGADMLLGMFAASRRGDFATVDPTLPRLLGRPATPVSEVFVVPAQA